MRKIRNVIAVVVILAVAAMLCLPALVQAANGSEPEGLIPNCEQGG